MSDTLGAAITMMILCVFASVRALVRAECQPFFARWRFELNLEPELNLDGANRHNQQQQLPKNTSALAAIIDRGVQINYLFHTPHSLQSRPLAAVAAATRRNSAEQTDEASPGRLFWSRMKSTSVW